MLPWENFGDNATDGRMRTGGRTAFSGRGPAVLTAFSRGSTRPAPVVYGDSFNAEMSIRRRSRSNKVVGFLLLLEVHPYNSD